MSAEPSSAERRARLERRANAIRSRLLRTIDALDVRKRQVTEMAQHGKRLALPIGLAMGAMLLTAGGVIVVRAVIRRRHERTFGARLTTFVRSVHVGDDKPSFLEAALRRVTLSVVGIVASELVRRAARNFLDGRLPNGRLLPAAGVDPLPQPR